MTQAPIRNWRPLAWYAGLVLLIVLAYRPAFRASWIWDDDQYVAGNSTLHTWQGLERIWTQPSASPQYYPMTLTSFWIGEKLWGNSPAGFHAVNVLLQAVNAILLWLILRKLNVPGAWLIAAVWGVHPVNVESVAWISERKNLLSGFFYFLAAIFYFDYAIDPLEHPRRRQYFLALVLFICSLLSKSVTATFPAAILLIIWWKRGRIRRSDIWPTIPFFILAILMGLATSWIEHSHVGATGSDFNFSLPHRFLIAGHAVWFYAYKVVWPVHLSFMYPKWPLEPWQSIYLGEMLVVLLVLAIFQKRIGRGPLTAVLFFIGTLIPALGFINVYPMRFSFVADHFQYLANIGLIALIIACICRSGRWVRRRPGKFFGAVLLFILFILTWNRANAFANRITLWRDTIAKDPESWMAHTNLGTALLDRAQEELALHQEYQAGRDLNEAQAEFQTTLRLRKNLVEPWLDLARVQELQAHYDQAEQILRRAITMDPKSAEPHFHLGAVLVKAGQVDAGIAEYRQALALDPQHVPAWVNLGVALDGQGNVQAAIHAYKKALQIDPGSVLALTNLGNALIQLGDKDAAALEFRKALQIEPGFLPAKSGLSRTQK